MEFMTIIAEHALAVSVLAGLALPVLAARLILAFERRKPRLFLASAAVAAAREPVPAHNLRLRRLPALAAQYSAAQRVRPAKPRVAPGLASRWKGAHRLAISA
jgi:hypothetical protein